ncbi:ankyrin repeat-containing domain protein [Globomyces pollinis-pini]|nr:ankyrin repeat-containing domain protein [Globomyces pollinis-pini]
MKLSELSLDILEIIASHLHIMDYQSLRFTCRNLYQLNISPSLTMEAYQNSIMHFKNCPLLMRLRLDSIHSSQFIHQPFMVFQFMFNHQQVDYLYFIITHFDLPYNCKSFLLEQSCKFGVLKIAEHLLLNDNSFDLFKYFNHSESRRIHPYLNHCVAGNHVGLVRLLIQDSRIDLSTHKNRLICWSCLYGYEDIVEIVLSRSNVDPSVNNNFPIRIASRNGHFAIIKRLLQHPLVDPSDYHDGALRWASLHGHLNCVKLLLNDSRVSYHSALYISSNEKYLPCLEYLTHLPIAATEENGWFNFESALSLLNSKTVRIIKQDPRFQSEERIIQLLCRTIECDDVESLKVLVEDLKINLLECKKLYISLIKSSNQIFDFAIYHLDIDPVFYNTLTLRMYEHFPDVNDVRLIRNSKCINPHENMCELVRLAAQLGEFQLLKQYLNSDDVDAGICDNQAIQYAAENGHASCVQILLENAKVNPSAGNNHAFRSAVKNGHLDCVRLLLGDARVDPAALYNESIRTASLGGHEAILRLLIAHPDVNVSAENEEAIRNASKNGHIDCLNLLLSHPTVNPGTSANSAIIQAAINGHTECVKALLKHPKVNPAARDNVLVRLMASKGELECLNLILQDERVDPTACNDMAIQEAFKNGHQECVFLLASVIPNNQSKELELL